MSERAYGWSIEETNGKSPKGTQTHESCNSTALRNLHTNLHCVNISKFRKPQNGNGPINLRAIG